MIEAKDQFTTENYRRLDVTVGKYRFVDLIIRLLSARSLKVNETSSGKNDNVFIL